MQTHSLACPQCGLTDKAEKVTAIIAGQTHDVRGASLDSQVYVDAEGRTHYREYTVPYTGTQASVLAQRLLPPKKPSVGSNSCAQLFACGLFFVAGAILCSALPGLLLIIAPSPSGRSGDFLLTNLFGIMMIGTFIAFSAFLAGVAGVAVWRTSNANYKKQVAQVQAEIPRWEHAMQRWSALYYCARDDGVFIPSENTFVPIAQMMDYLYQ